MATPHLRFDPWNWPGHKSALTCEDGLHFVLKLAGGIEHRLLLPGTEPPPDGMPLRILFDPDPHWSLRVAATERFLVFAAPKIGIRRKPPPRSSAEERERHAHMLWALDLAQAGASEHEIGRAVLGTASSGAAWSNDPDRSELRRLLAAARGFVRGGYRTLLGSCGKG